MRQMGWLPPSLRPIAASLVSLLALHERRRRLVEVSAEHARAEKIRARRCFVGTRITASSPDALLAVVDTLGDSVKEAKDRVREARASGEWDDVHDVELQVGNDAIRMDFSQFAQYVHHLRYHEIGATDEEPFPGTRV